MGIDLCCGDMCLSYAYSSWNDIRMAIAEACVKYCEDSVKDYDLENDTNRYHVDMITLLNQYKVNKPINIIAYLKSFDSFDIIDAFTFFRVIGICDLLNKSDCEGFYSPGASLDIYTMLELIKPYLPLEDNEFPFDDILTLFKTSYVLKENVLMS